MSSLRAVTILTPEHVPVRLTPAGLGSRFCALSLDACLILGISVFTTTAATLLLPASLEAAAALTLSFVLVVGYHPFFDIRHEGRSPGKRALGLRVVDARGLPMTTQQALVRSILRTLDFLPFGYALGALAALVDPHGRRLGDLVAGTLVVDERGARLLAAQLPPARRYNSLRTPRIRALVKHRLGLEERDFLVTLCHRADRLDPAARFELMEEAARLFREWLEIDDPDLSGEAMIRDLASLATGDR